MSPSRNARPAPAQDNLACISPPSDEGSSGQSDPAAPRRYDLDWIRVIVFGLLILYHVGMFFVPWDWHIKNNTTEPWLTWPMAFLNRWRLPILFVISGMGTRLALSKRSGREFLAERTMRLLVPLLFGILVVVPPQVYVERQVEGAEYSSYLEFYPHFFQGIYPTGNFSWHHLWFLPYLLVYSFVLSPVFLYLRNHPQAGWQRAVQRGLGNGAIWLALAIPLLIVEVGLRPYFPTTHNLIWDWYNFTRYLLLFFYGFLLISVQPDFWKALDRWGGAGLAVGLLTFALLTWFRDLPLRFSGAIYLAAIVEVVNLGAWCVAIFGLAARLLNRPSRLLSYCNAAVYPCYIVHQTILVLCAYMIYDQAWPSLAKFLLLAVCTLIGSLLVYELARRLPGIRILLGIKPPVATSIR